MPRFSILHILSTAVAVTGMVGLAGPASTAVAAAAPPETASESWADDVVEALEAILEALEAADKQIDEDEEGPLDEEDQEQALAKVDTAAAQWEEVLADPVFAGSFSLHKGFSGGLGGYAAGFAELAETALEEATGPGPDWTFVGDVLMTLDDNAPEYERLIELGP